AGATNFDSFSAEVLGGLQSFFHRAPEGNAAFELDSDVFGNQLCIGFGRLDFDDVHVNFFAGHAAELFLEFVNFSAFAADNDAGAGGEDGNSAAAGGAFDANLGHRGSFELLLEEVADFAVFSE